MADELTDWSAIPISKDMTPKEWVFKSLITVLAKSVEKRSDEPKSMEDPLESAPSKFASNSNDASVTPTGDKTVVSKSELLISKLIPERTESSSQPEFESVTEVAMESKSKVAKLSKSRTASEPKVDPKSTESAEFDE